MLKIILTIIVGISCSGMKESTAEYYAKCLQDAGAEMVIFDRYALDEAMAEDLMGKVDALIIPGKAKKDTASRNKFDKRLIKVALRDGKPILGICKGHQCIDSYFGGKTKKNEDSHPDSDIQHKYVDKDKYNVTLNTQCHSISIVEGSRLSKCLGGVTEIKVNSSHNWNTTVIGEGLTVTATAPDGIVEAIEGEGVMGVQFHPEFLYGKMDIKPFLGIFQELVDLAKANKERK